MGIKTDTAGRPWSGVLTVDRDWDTETGQKIPVLTSSLEAAWSDRNTWRLSGCSDGSHGRISKINNCCNSDSPPSAKYASIFHESLLWSRSRLGKTSSATSTKAFISLSLTSKYSISLTQIFLSLPFGSVSPASICILTMPLTRWALGLLNLGGPEKTKQSMSGNWRRGWERRLQCHQQPHVPLIIRTGCPEGVHNEKGDSHWLLSFEDPYPWF